MSKSRSTSLAGLVIPLGLGALVLAGYSIYWVQTARAIKATCAKAMPNQPTSSIRVTGFPYRFEMRFKDLKLASPVGFGFEASRFVVAASPFNLNLWVLEGALDPTLITPKGSRHLLFATDLRASLRLRDRQVARLSVTFKDLKGVDAAFKSGAASSFVWQVGPSAMHVIADPKDSNRLAMSLEMADMVLSQAPNGQARLLGDRITRIRLAGPISQGQTLLKSAKRWADAQGNFTLMAAELVWGPVSLTHGGGIVSLNPSGDWQGQIRGTGALKPEGLSLHGLETPIEVRIVDGWIDLLGYKVSRLPKAFD
ncbi:DUF2125 domain-containing protein [Candidatus Phycosocius spiralis]|uniref:DUF2125 domain-containing protein n=1 Tax=Candidatus Phycosocius spiralis TaxID=2815099 RepID=A0ABQ4PV04_9PROT|nr:DUF2125 domain-containing protein [Candidatus Phycosocius spiralis]GIU66770.1 hypothetical protein PsB1_0924 [Candidatus Phycosocius spiralis]